MNRIIYFGIILVIVAVLAWMAQALLPKPLPKDSSSGEALIGGKFALINQHGTLFTQEELKDKHSLIFFGFTHCPDVCPTGLLTITQAIESVGDKTEHVQPIFITVDPERDTPERIGQYVVNFSDKVVGLTGTPEQLKEAQQAYKVYARKVDMPHMGEGEYMVDHSGFIFLMGPDGKYRTHFPYNSPSEVIAQALLTHIHQEE